MRKLIALIGLIVGLSFAASAQTNIVNISNSQVTINYVTVISTNAPTNAPATVGNDTKKEPSKKVVLPMEVVERLRWEELLQARRIANMNAYLRRLEKQ